MTAIKSTLIIFLLGFATSRVLRSYCGQNTGDFGISTRRSMSGYFQNAVTEIKSAIKDINKASGSGKKGSKNNGAKNFDSFVSTFSSQAKFIHDAKKAMGDDEVKDYCEGLVDMYNYLMGGCSDNSNFRNICMTYAEKIDVLFGKNSVHQSNGNGGSSGKKGGHQAGNRNRGANNGNKYANLKNKQKNQVVADLPEEEAVEVQIQETKADTKTPQSHEEEHVNFNETPRETEEAFLRETASPQNKIEIAEKEYVEIAGQTPQQENQDEQEQQEEQQVVQEAQVNQGAQQEQPVASTKRIKKVIVVEVLSCKNCDQDEAFKKYFVQSG